MFGRSFFRRSGIRALVLALLGVASFESAARAAAVTVAEGRLPFANSGGSDIDQGHPFQASSAYSQSHVPSQATTASSAESDLRTGVLRASAATTGSRGVSQAQASAYFSDVLTFHVPDATGGTVTPIGFAFDMRGAMAGDGDSSTERSFVFAVGTARTSGQASLYEQIYSAGGVDYPSGVSFVNSGFLSLSRMVLGDVTRITGLFEVVGPAAVAGFSLNLQARAADGGTSNHSIGNFNFTYPVGVTFASASGVFLSEAGADIPEPAALALFGLGLLSLAALRRRKVA